MALAPGARLGPYEVLEQIGEGGMGEVYKATDTRLNRTVALKVLPRHFSSNPEMRERFEREARAIASLNHPHICTLHDIGREDDQDFLVIEYLEGETLAERLKRGPLPLDEAMKVAAEIGDALDKAHAAGIVHRDLKPSNIMLTPSAGTKLLDFGLAKWTPQASSVIDSMAPTRAPSAPGMIVGTLEYMAPEQLDGKEADARSDIFALGVIFYEAVTGRKAFEGKTRTILIASILTGDPDPMPQAPPSLDHTIRRCLAKDPENRWQTAHDFVVQVQWIGGGGDAAVPTAIAARQRKRERLLLAAMSALGLIAAVLATPALRYFQAAAPDAFEFRAPMMGLSPENTAISPDGRQIAAVLRPDGQGASSLYVRPVGSITSRKLAGTDDAAMPFWSPNSRFIAYVAGGKLRKVDASGGPPQDISAAPDFAGGAWSADGEGQGTIVFGSSKGLFRVSAEGGTPSALTTVEKPQTGHFWPEFLPDGRHYIFLAWSGEATNRALFSASLDSKDKPAKLMPAESNVAYAPPGYLLLHREATLFAQPFNAKTLALKGEAVHVADGVAYNPASGRGDFDVSQEGTLIYSQGNPNASTGRGGRGQTAAFVQFAWVSRSGVALEAAGDQGPYGDFDLSPDGKLIALTRQETGAAGADIWLVDWQRAGVANPVTFDPADDVNPVFSPDGKQIAFTSYRKGNADIYVKNANGTGPETPLVESPANESVEAWSTNGYIVYLVEHDNVQDIWAKPMSGDGKPLLVDDRPFRKDEPQVSFDGKWLAYTAETGGKFQVWVTSFPKPDQFVQVSKDGGGQPRWRRDGKELYFRDLTNRIMSASIDVKDGKIEPRPPQLLFVPDAGNAVLTMSEDPTRHQLAVSEDGQRFLIRIRPQAVGAGNRGRGGRGRSNAPIVNIYTADTVNNVNRGAGFRGRGGYLGFTVVRNWTSALGKAAK